jgi:TPR repeat protein
MEEATVKRMSKFVFAGAIVAVVAIGAVLLMREEDRHQMAAKDSPQSFTLFGGIGSTGTGSQSGTKVLSVPTGVKSYMGIGGHLFDLQGLTALQFIQKYSQDARRGDAYAAYRVYQAEALCAGISDAKGLSETFSHSKYRAQAYSDNLTDLVRTCDGVTPALTDERRQFLAQAATGGVPDALTDFYVEGPGVSKDDPAYFQWGQQTVGFLQQASLNGNRMALIYLSNLYEDGTYVAKDPEKALSYAVAYAELRTGTPEVNPLVRQLSAGLSIDQQIAAYQQGKQYAQQIHQRRPS